MRKILFIIFLFWSLCVQCQYGNQDSIKITTVDPFCHCTVQRTALFHKPADTTIRHAVFVYLPGKGHDGDCVTGCGVNQSLMSDGPAYFLKRGYNGKAYNTQTGDSEELAIFSIRCWDYRFDQAAEEAFLNWLYYQSPYKNYIDTNRVTISGVSAGGSAFFLYSAHYQFIPSHKVNWVMEIDPATNNYIPARFLVADSVRMFNGGYAQYDAHGFTAENHVDSANAVKSNYAQFLNNPDPNCCGVGTDGHCQCAFLKWYDPVLDTTYHDNNYNIPHLNIYSASLLYSQGVNPVPTQTITLGAITGTPVCLNGSATITVNFSTAGTFGTGNAFELLLSDITGNFAGAKVIGSSATHTIAGTITGVTTGSGYKVLVRASNPNVNSLASAKFSINVASNSIAPTTVQNIAPGVNGNTLTATEGSIPTSRQWYDGTNIIAGATGLTYTPNFLTPGAHVVSLKSTFACGVKTSNSVTVNVAATTSHRIYPTKLADNSINLNGCNGSFKYSHGDTIVITAAQNPYSSISLSCIDSVTVINEGGQVITTCFNSCGIPGGFNLYNCTHIHLTGTGTVGVLRGFFNTSTGNRGIGVQISGRSAWIEVDHCEMYNKNAGFWVKQEQQYNNCDSNYGFPKWNLHDFKLHDNYIHNMSAEGMYLGSTAPDPFQFDPNNQHPAVWCLNGVSSTDSVAGSVVDSVTPMHLGNFEIYNNIIDSTMRGGIQLSDADSGRSKIHDNHVTRNGFEYSSTQGNNITTGTYTVADIYNNYMDSSYSDNVRMGGAYTNVYNNTIQNAGKLNGHTNANAANININDPAQNNVEPGRTSPDSTTFIIGINTYGNKTSAYNITANNQHPTQWSHQSQICSGTYSIPTGIPFSTTCGGPVTTCDTVKTQPRDTCCKVISVTHDTTVIRYYDSIKVVARYFKKGKWQLLSTNVFSNVPYPKDTTTTHDSSVNFKTTPVDTIICTTGAVGIFYLNDGTVSFQHVMDTAAYVGVNWLRLNYTLGSGAPYNVGNATANSIHTLLTLNNSSNGAAGYGTKADSLITVAAPDWITNDNEPAINDSANIAASLSGLSALITVAHNHNIKVADGGFEKTIVLNYVKDLQDRGKTDSANTIISLYSLNMTSAASLHFILKNDSLLNGYSTMNLDANALHWGEPYFDTSVTTLSNYLPEVAHFITRRTGKPIIITELGITNHNCALLTALVKQAIQTARLVFYFDGRGADGRYYKLQECIKTIVSGL